jgi:predicted DNA-binding protein (MmcQ/YjbR family)
MLKLDSIVKEKKKNRTLMNFKLEESTVNKLKKLKDLNPGYTMTKIVSIAIENLYDRCNE